MNTRIDTNHYEATSQNVNAILARHGHWLLRAGFASVFLFHGVEKFVMGIGGFAAMMNLPVTVAFLVALAEVLAGVGIIVGATVRNRLGDIVTRLAGLAAAPVLVGAIAMVHWGQWSFVASDSHPMGGMEFQVVLLLLALSFILRGNQS
ncbi:DoxX family protein [Ectothiorhodospira sp. BSL-9]|uniref:DoxX family protein n=1 Tax=Ectothiorhodospira sp. BSL-9 TaxID=1442136 RepID=UPI0007B53BFF|nr:DoxX family protein [Ectothiorhodospira sp. BSL-9]